MPAINVRTYPRIAPHPGNSKRGELDGPQKDSCDFARVQAKENSNGGIPVFPGETSSIELGVGISGIYKIDDRVLFSIYGCIDYSYSEKMRYGQTGYRMVLGQDVGGRVLGLSFEQGVVMPYEEAIPAELLQAGRPKELPKIAESTPSKLVFREDQGGNYAK